MKMRLALAALGGFVVGMVAMWCLVARTTGPVFANQYLGEVMNKANTVACIRAGRPMEVVSNIDVSLPNDVLAVDRGFREYPASTNVLCAVRDYYEQNHLAVPPKIRGVLDSLPSRPVALQ
jgi:hypothetical protein